MYDILLLLAAYFELLIILLLVLKMVVKNQAEPMTNPMAYFLLRSKKIIKNHKKR